MKIFGKRKEEISGEASQQLSQIFDKRDEISVGSIDEKKRTLHSLMRKYGVEPEIRGEDNRSYEQKVKDNEKALDEITQGFKKVNRLMDKYIDNLNKGIK